MVSRAVAKKKERREKKRNRDEGCVVPNINTPPPREDDEDDDVPTTSNAVCDSEVKTPNISISHAEKQIIKSKVSDKKVSARSLPTATPQKQEVSSPDVAVSHESDQKVPEDSHLAEPKLKAHRSEKVQINEESAPAAASDQNDSRHIATDQNTLPPSHIVTKLSNLDRPLSRKERLKLETAMRHEKQLERQQLLGERLSAAEAEALQQYKIGLSNKKSGEGDDDAEVPEPPKLPEIGLRHDERFIGGTYWKERKDRKRKTLFVGNLPMYFDQHATKDYIVSVFAENGIVDSTQQAAQIEARMLDFAAGKITDVEKKSNSKKKTDKDGGIYGEHCPILTIDFLPVKANARTRHAYIVFRTLELAVKAQQLLNGAKPEPHNINRLRVNFSEDKDQRDLAINKREGSKNLRGGRGGRGGQGGRGASGRGRGGFGGSRGGGRGRTFGPGFGFGRGSGSVEAATN